MFKDWSERGKGEKILDIYNNLSRKLSNFQEASCRVIVPPPIQGLGLSGGFQMEVELTDGSFDYQQLQKVTEHFAAQSASSPVIDAAITTFRADVPQLNLDVNRTEAATFNVAVGDVFDTLQSYLGFYYVNQFTKFGHTFTVFAQADEKFRLTSRKRARLLRQKPGWQHGPARRRFLRHPCCRPECDLALQPLSRRRVSWKSG